VNSVWSILPRHALAPKGGRSPRQPPFVRTAAAILCKSYDGRKMRRASGSAGGPGSCSVAARPRGGPAVRQRGAGPRKARRARCVRLCAGAGRKEPYRFYLPLLDVKGTKLAVKTEKGEEAGASYFEEPVSEVFAKEIVAVFSREKAVAEIARKHSGAAGQVAPLKAWLEGRLKE
jgi:hypothetical protein